MAVSQSVTMAAPRVSAAMVTGMPGMVNGRKIKTLSGVTRTLWDGIVLRKTRIADGKVIIPPAGMYTTVRSGNWKPFDNEPITLGGKSFYYITQRAERDVLHSVTFVPGEVKPMNHTSRGWQLVEIEKDPFLMRDAYMATFKLVKTTGNYYGASFPVIMGKNVNNDGSNGLAASAFYEQKGLSARTGRLDSLLMGKNVAADGRSYVVVDAITPEEVHVREMATDSITHAWISPTAPIVARYAQGAVFSIGTTCVEVLRVSSHDVHLRVTQDGISIEKILGPWDEATQDQFVFLEEVRDRLWLLSPNGKEIIHLNGHAPEGPFGENSVSLVAYTDVVDVQDGSSWPFDTRFLARPET